MQCAITNQSNIITIVMKKNREESVLPHAAAIGLLFWPEKSFVR